MSAQLTNIGEESSSSHDNDERERFECDGDADGDGQNRRRCRGVSRRRRRGGRSGSFNPGLRRHGSGERTESLASGLWLSAATPFALPANAFGGYTG